MILNFAKNLKALRMRRGLTQSELAEELGVSSQAVSRWENTTHTSYPDIELLPIIAGYFDVSVDELLGCSKAQKDQWLKRYWARVDACDKTEDGFIQKHELLKEMYQAYPEDPEIMNAFCLSKCWTHAWLNAHDLQKDLKLLLEMTEKLQRCNVRHYRENAVKVLINAIDDAHLEECLDKYTSDMDLSRYQLLEWRYAGKRDSAPDRYYDIRQRNLLYAIGGLFSIKSGNKDDLENTEYRLWHSKMLIDVMDALCDHPCTNLISGDGTPDLWSARRIFQGITLSECICTSGKEEALAILADAADLAEKLCALPEGTVLCYRSPCLDHLTAPLVRKISGQQAGTGKTLVLAAHVSARNTDYGLHYCPQSIYEHLLNAAAKGGFASIRETAQFKKILTRFQSMTQLE